MKTVYASSSYNGFTRSETRTDEFALHEDFLLLSSLCEAAAKTAYLLEHTSFKDEESREQSVEALREIFGRLKNQYYQIDGYDILFRKDKKA